MKKRTHKSEWSETRHIYVAVLGAGPDGIGSGFAWADETSGRECVKAGDSLTESQAYHNALLDAVQNIPPGARVYIYPDYQPMVSHFTEEFEVRDASLQKLMDRVCEVILGFRLNVTLHRVPLERNAAAKLLDTFRTDDGRPW